VAVPIAAHAGTAVLKVMVGRSELGLRPSCTPAIDRSAVVTRQSVRAARMLRNDLLDAVASHDGEDVGGMIEGVEMATPS
jgi:hypothetical protein